ncbi:ABC transporter ATP-binding protein [Methyloterricola oryzae]|uniref:ABC transporter ATP-binding protein n=1 Tax=Methyloterricola oryzae TaxID=1495050 RepID=UPI0019106167|nr:ATP-binding cassette domain-containing protein [Methyloterricola oryzae]
MPIIEAENISKWVDTADGRLDILTAVGLSINAAETVAIVGASGSGKSTLLGLLAGLDLPSAGDVRLAGKNLSGLSEDGRALMRSRHVGFVFQAFQLLANLTALENVMLPLELLGAPDAAKAARHMLARVGLDKRLRHYPRQLSGGEQQRVALARAFVTSPPILFADEPTGNLDSKTGRHVIDLLFELNREQRATLVLVTHDEALASRCGRTVRIEEGRVVEDRP